MKKIIYFFFIGFLLVNFSACFSPNGELTGRKTTRLDYTIADPLGMQPIPGGSFTMGANDQDVPYSNSSMKTITISPFWIDATEITNDEYRQFTHWVRDSIIRRYLVDNVDEQKWGWPKDPNPNWNSEQLMDATETYDPDTYYIDWYKNLNFQNDEVTEAMTATLIMEDQMWDQETNIRPFFQTKLIDTRKLIYEYNWFNRNAASPKANRYQYDDDYTEGDYRELEGGREEAFLVKERIPVYPDTLTWIHDFTYNFNEPMFDKYFWHPAYGDYPVVGVSWKQAKAFCHWRTAYKLYHLPQERRQFETEYRLPTEAEWEWAARGGRELAMFPWGGPYSRNVKGCFLANFKPLRGNYWADGYIYTAPSDHYPANDYFLYNMAGNVAEWTESAFDPMADLFSSDLNPEYTYDAQSEDHPHFKKKVVKGGSWKDIGAFLQIGARDFEYQDSSRCYIGFRCVKSRPYQEGKGQFEEIFQGVKDKKQKKKKKKNK
ncbi:MAG: gliding motility-associated lipoprotein [Flavobacteriales bacterium]|nr:gliding motility-associated lipoprotein [Flavobacteriales bacterium]